MASQAEFRPALTSDLPALFAIEKAAGYSQWTQAQLADSLSFHHVWVVLRHGRVVGYAVFSKVLDESELLNIVVLPECRGRGLGQGLLQQGLHDVRLQGAVKCFLEVGVNNQSAIDLYQRYGFARMGFRKNYYQHVHGAEDALVMQLNLEEMPC